MDLMTFKGFCAQVEYDAADETFIGRITGIADIVGFHADTVDDLKGAFHEAVEDYIEACARTGGAPR
ncbi:MAG: type II toxin-antitoxin system HicB family antitoxin [Caulobacter sp.]|nr:type II toxin-antitoxin system HicB family antitoxin [Caulobacter sp.]